MKTFVTLAFAASALATPMLQARAPAGCSSSRDGTFQISVVNVTKSAKRDVDRRQLSGTLTVSLKDSVLKDQAGRTGSVVANHQFQFDNPVQANAIATSGFSFCSNGSLATGNSAVWYQCFSGSFYNIYDQSQGKQCNQIYLVATGGAPVSQQSDGQPAASTAVPVSQMTDGQPQVPTGLPVTQISDGQPQVPTGLPVSQISDGQPQVPTGVGISQISDGQPQVPTGTPGPIISQISDGQPQIPTATPPGPVISQISDGQPQVPTAAPTSAPGGPIISQISDGQPQVPIPTGNYTVPNATATAPSQFTGAAATPIAGVGAFAAGLFALAAML